MKCECKYPIRTEVDGTLSMCCGKCGGDIKIYKANNMTEQFDKKYGLIFTDKSLALYAWIAYLVGFISALILVFMSV